MRIKCFTLIAVFFCQAILGWQAATGHMGLAGSFATCEWSVPWESLQAIGCGLQSRCAVGIIVVELGGTISLTALPSKDRILLKIHRKGVRIDSSWYLIRMKKKGLRVHLCLAMRMSTCLRRSHRKLLQWAELLGRVATKVVGVWGKPALRCWFYGNLLILCIGGATLGSSWALASSSAIDLVYKFYCFCAVLCFTSGATLFLSWSRRRRFPR